MAIFLDENSRIIVQGMTGSEGTKHTRRMLASGANVVGGVNARHRDGRAVAQCNHRVAVGVVRHVRLDVAEARDAGEADEVDLVGGEVEIVQRVVADRLREHEQVVTGGSRELIVARPREDRRILRVDLNVIRDEGCRCTTIRAGVVIHDL